jgi:hypothetical protein
MVIARPRRAAAATARVRKHAYRGDRLAPTSTVRQSRPISFPEGQQRTMLDGPVEAIEQGETS